MFGQDNPTCIPKRHLPVFEADYGRPCPHVLLQHANKDAATLCIMLLSEHQRPLAPLFFEYATEGFPSDEKRAILSRVNAAIRSETVTDHLYPKRDKKKD